MCKNEHMMKKIFLDLEGTVITTWGDAMLCNTAVVGKFLKAEGVTEVDIFSFAVYDDADRQSFNNGIKKALEMSSLGVTINHCPTVDDMMRVVKRFTMTAWTRQEMLSVWGKYRTFVDYCRAQYKDMECVLVDDVVPNMTIVDHDKNLTIRFVNVETLLPRSR